MRFHSYYKSLTRVTSGFGNIIYAARGVIDKVPEVIRHQLGYNYNLYTDFKNQLTDVERS